MGDTYITLAMVMMAVSLGSLLVWMILSFVKRKVAVWFLLSFVLFFGLFFVFLIVGGNMNKESLVNGENSTMEEAIIVETVDLSVTYDDIYLAYKKNELAADDIYKDNRYQITAVINGLSSGGLLNLTGGATLTMQTQVGNTIVFFYAVFEKDQEEALKKVVVGDTITFEGKCLSAGTWVECELID